MPLTLAVVPGSTVILEIQSAAHGVKAQVAMEVQEDPPARIISMTPNDGMAGLKHLINLEVEHMTLQGLTATFRLKDTEGEIMIADTQDSLCAATTCASASLVLEVAPSNQEGAMEISICSGEHCVLHTLPFCLPGVFGLLHFTRKPHGPACGHAIYLQNQLPYLKIP